jgi:carbonic anhydrase
MSIRTRLSLLTALWAAFAVGCSRPTAGVGLQDNPMHRLTSGNERFANGRAIHPHADATRRLETSQQGQHPFAAIVSCSDSRAPLEIVFDQGIGDLFAIRVAGNICATDETGTIEYAVEHLHIRLVVVLGHRDCGAVTAVVNGAIEHGSLPALLGHITPSVEAAKRKHPGLEGPALVSEVIEENVWHGIEDLLTHSESVKERVREGSLQVVGAIYDLQTGVVRWLGTHPRQAELLSKQQQ